jgi:hypothetical protein
MQMKQQPEYQPSLKPDLERLRTEAISKLREAVVTIHRYTEAAHKAAPFRTEGLDQDEIDRILERELFPLYVGPPGEVCDSCGGSGRKQK